MLNQKRSSLSGQVTQPYSRHVYLLPFNPLLPALDPLVINDSDLVHTRHSSNLTSLSTAIIDGLARCSKWSEMSKADLVLREDDKNISRMMEEGERELAHLGLDLLNRIFNAHSLRLSKYLYEFYWMPVFFSFTF